MTDQNRLVAALARSYDHAGATTGQPEQLGAGEYMRQRLLDKMTVAAEAGDMELVKSLTEALQNVPQEAASTEQPGPTPGERFHQDLTSQLNGQWQSTPFDKAA